MLNCESNYEKIIELYYNLKFLVKRFINNNISYDFHESWSFQHLTKVFFFLLMSMKTKWNELISLINNSKNLIDLNLQLKKDNNIINKFKNKNDLHDKKFVCLHVRDGGFKNDNDRRSFRNADINNYIELIRYFCDMGLKVIRMGDNKMNQCNYKNNNFIDYPFSTDKSELIDLYLLKNCEFYVGMDSGIKDVALLFNKPGSYDKLCKLAFFISFKRIDRSLMKNIFYNKEQKITFLSRIF